MPDDGHILLFLLQVKTEVETTGLGKTFPTETNFCPIKLWGR